MATKWRCCRAVSGGSQPTLPVRGNCAPDPAGPLFCPDSAALSTCEVSNRAFCRVLDGAIVTFQGVVRNNTRGRATLRLDYECYEGMAIRKMAEIGRAIAGEFPVSRMAMVHRLGTMEVGEASVRGDCHRAAQASGIRRRARRHQSPEATGSDMEEGVFCGWRSLGGGRMG